MTQPHPIDLYVDKEIELNDDNYVERDESWMYFNHRILYEAQREDIPLLERVHFLGIYSNNLDEFFRVRVASIQRNIEDDDSGSGKVKRSKKLLDKIYDLNEAYKQEVERTFRKLMKELWKEHIHVVNETLLTPEQEHQVFDIYARHLSSSINPLFLDRMSDPQEQLDESNYLAVDLREMDEDGEEKSSDVAVIRMPQSGEDRFVRLPDDPDGNKCVMFIDDVIRYNLKHIFAGLPYNSFEGYSFKFTKDADEDLVDDNSYLGLLQQVSRGLKKRSLGETLRVVYDRNMPKRIRDLLFKAADLDKNDARVAGSRYHNSRDLMDFPDCGRSDLLYKPWHPIIGKHVDFTTGMLDSIRRKDQWLHFPYHSFDSFVRVLQEAAISDDVEEIKATIYRVPKRSSVVNALMAAARNGKRVTCVIELLARFNEESNISFAQKMKDAGVRVLFGPGYLKIHSKLALIKARRGNIACIGTGNMHEGNAKTYTDFMMMTARRGIVNDVDRVFDFIEQPYLTTRFRELLVSPNTMRSRFERLIDTEIQNAKAGLSAYIKVKVNHIVDEEIVKRLYRASQAGVEIRLVVRGNCSLVPGIEGLSDHIFINGIIDRYLEHSRIFIFCNGGKPKYFLGSADWMSRNLDRRVEVVTPVYDADLKRELELVIDYGLKDVHQRHYVNEQDREPRRFREEKPWFRSQEALYLHYLEEER